ncbi:MAG: pantetheine-phosphate adenylyltransferase [Lachnospiraceae bacterium]|nr:pantetheine-phosphate adenylyltransferase [Lachnospiraceae bacterium]
MSKAVFPGSFDPVTNGHLDLIKRASKMFDGLVVGVLINSAKKPLFSIEERVEMLEELTSEFGNVTVQSFDGLLVDFVKMTGSDVIVRGLRTSQDFEYELPLAQTNYKLSDGTDTIFLATSPEHSYISSSAVKELLRYNADISNMVPAQVYKRLT